MTTTKICFSVRQLIPFFRLWTLCSRLNVITDYWVINYMKLTNQLFTCRCYDRYWWNAAMQCSNISCTPLAMFSWGNLYRHITQFGQSFIQKVEKLYLTSSIYMLVCLIPFLCVCTVGSYASHSVCLHVCMPVTGPKFRLDKKSYIRKNVVTLYIWFSI